MHADIAAKRSDLIALCRQFGVARFEVFGSAASGNDFDTEHSDADFLVTFAPETRNDLTVFIDFRDALEALLGRPVDIVEREAVESSRNHIRRNAILAGAQAIHG